MLKGERISPPFSMICLSFSSCFSNVLRTLVWILLVFLPKAALRYLSFPFLIRLDLLSFASGRWTGHRSSGLYPFCRLHLLFLSASRSGYRSTGRHPLCGLHLLFLSASGSGYGSTGRHPLCGLHLLFLSASRSGYRSTGRHPLCGLHLLFLSASGSGYRSTGRHPLCGLHLLFLSASRSGYRRGSWEFPVSAGFICFSSLPAGLVTGERAGQSPSLRASSAVSLVFLCQGSAAL